MSETTALKFAQLLIKKHIKIAYLTAMDNLKVFFQVFESRQRLQQQHSVTVTEINHSSEPTVQCVFTNIAQKYNSLSDRIR